MGFKLMEVELNKKRLALFDKLQNDIQSDSAKNVEQYLDCLKAHGFGKGDLIANTEGTYKITKYRISGSERGLRVYMYGVKFRKDKTFGTHLHYISTWPGV